MRVRGAIRLPAMTIAPHHEYTFEEYVQLERDSPIKHEFLNGEIYAMAGGTPEHAALAMYLGNALIERLRGGHCRVYSSDLNVRVRTTGLATYPDVTVVCGPVERDPEHTDTVTNAKVVIEVTSRSTEKYDRGEKLDNYQQAPSIECVVIASHRERCIETWNRTASGWQRSEARGAARARIECLDCDLDVDAIYGAAGL